jgi:hypothetical protein
MCLIPINAFLSSDEVVGNRVDNMRIIIKYKRKILRADIYFNEDHVNRDVTDDTNCSSVILLRDHNASRTTKCD